MDKYIGKRFWKYTVVEKIEPQKDDKHVQYRCVCDCGKEKIIKEYKLAWGRTTLCSCEKGKRNDENDLTGRSFGILRVIASACLDGSKKNYSECLCQCGKKVSIPNSQLRGGIKKSCGCLHHHDDRTVAIKKRLYSHAIKYTNKKYDEASDIDFEWYVNMISQPCHYCGVEFSNLASDKSHMDGRLLSDAVVRYNGIDRIDSSIGYLKSNTVTCCKHCNISKGDMSQKEFEKWIQQVYCRLY